MSDHQESGAIRPVHPPPLTPDGSSHVLSALTDTGSRWFFLASWGSPRFGWTAAHIQGVTPQKAAEMGWRYERPATRLSDEAAD